MVLSSIHRCASCKTWRAHWRHRGPIDTPPHTPTPPPLRYANLPSFLLNIFPELEHTAGFRWCTCTVAELGEINIAPVDSKTQTLQSLKKTFCFSELEEALWCSVPESSPSMFHVPPPGCFCLFQRAGLVLKWGKTPNLGVSDALNSNIWNFADVFCQSTWKPNWKPNPAFWNGPQADNQPTAIISIASVVKW